MEEAVSSTFTVMKDLHILDTILAQMVVGGNALLLSCLDLTLIKTLKIYKLIRIIVSNFLSHINH